MKVLFLFLSLGLLAGCATTSRVWYQSGKTSAQAYQDMIDCRAEAHNKLDPYGISGFQPHWGFGNPTLDNYTVDCMRAKGYELVDPGKIPSGSHYPPKH